ncbi:flavodoxin domain-containing protein [Brumicola nitratireducens]|uniref:Flavodoxin n=1 Tax=Glaciecola nitratireducens (strain JCM 12485 / KCTC 12276 / FR1064) TaxID=1085623 RepID=G4QI28_GLANF|nr:flavodoxin domain-containing protein [Glaciecola nitratireducens]AEP30561.1 flavodoxin [Glaciecola nitratireducens FR1064]
MRSVSIFAGSVYGNAQHVAEEAKTMFESKGVECEIFTDPETSDFSEAESIVVITSSTGQGDIPPNLELFHSDLRDEFPLINGKPFAVAALGDSSYGESFCGAGRQFQELLEELQGKPVANMLEVDAIETLAAEEEIVPWLENLVTSLTEA